MFSVLVTAATQTCPLISFPKPMSFAGPASAEPSFGLGPVGSPGLLLIQGSSVLIWGLVDIPIDQLCGQRPILILSQLPAFHVSLIESKVMSAHERYPGKRDIDSGSQSCQARGPSTQCMLIQKTLLVMVIHPTSILAILNYNESESYLHVIDYCSHVDLH